MLDKLLIHLVAKHSYKIESYLMNYLASGYKSSSRKTGRILERYNLTLAPTSYDVSERTKTLPL